MLNGEINGIGIDIIEIDRIKKACLKWDQRFIKRIFTQKEISYCTEKKNPFSHFAVRFAAKEAVIKAISYSINWLDIEIINQKNKSPYCKIYKKLKDLKNKKILISLSHSKKNAIAICIISN